MRKEAENEKCAFAIISVVMLAVMLSCEHKELYNGIPHVVNARVIFDWQKAPDANPASMSLYLFPVGGGEVVRYDFTDRKEELFVSLTGHIACCA